MCAHDEKVSRARFAIVAPSRSLSGFVERTLGALGVCALLPAMLEVGIAMALQNAYGLGLVFVKPVLKLS